MLFRSLAQGHQGIEETIRNPIVFTGISPEELKNNPPIKYGDQLVYALPDGDVKRLPPTTGSLPETFRLMDVYMNIFGTATTWTGGAQGQRDGMYVSGQGQQELSRPMGSKIDNLKRIEAERYARVNMFILQLYERHFAEIGRASCRERV